MAARIDAVDAPDAARRERCGATLRRRAPPSRRGEFESLPPAPFGSPHPGGDRVWPNPRGTVPMPRRRNHSARSNTRKPSAPPSCRGFVLRPGRRVATAAPAGTRTRDVRPGPSGLDPTGPPGGGRPIAAGSPRFGAKHCARHRRASGSGRAGARSSETRTAGWTTARQTASPRHHRCSASETAPPGSPRAESAPTGSRAPPRDGGSPAGIALRPGPEPPRHRFAAPMATAEWLGGHPELPPSADSAS